MSAAALLVLRVPATTRSFAEHPAGHPPGRARLRLVTGDAWDERPRIRSVPDLADDSPATPEELLMRVGRGDQAAFEDLYDRVVGIVLGMARRILRDEAQAEEVAQEVMVEVWRTAPRFDQTKGSARSWVATMAHRRAVDRVRAAQASTDRERRVAARERAVEYDEVVDAVEARFERDEVQRAMGSLTHLQREAIELAYFEGCTQREVAQRLDIPLGTAKTRLRDGLLRLRTTLGVT